MTDIEQRIADETAAKLRIPNLKRAHEQLDGIRRHLKGVASLLDQDPSIAHLLVKVAVNDIENAMWKIETAIREEETK